MVHELISKSISTSTGSLMQALMLAEERPGLPIVIPAQTEFLWGCAFATAVPSHAFISKGTSAEGIMKQPFPICLLHVAGSACSSSALKDDWEAVAENPREDSVPQAYVLADDVHDSFLSCRRGLCRVAEHFSNSPGILWLTELSDEAPSVNLRC